VSLVVHGFSAMAVFGETIGVRVLVGAASLTLASALVAVFAAATARSGLALWSAVSLVLWFEALVGSVFFVISILASRSTTGFLPVRDHRFFVSSERVLRDAP
jgi:hypothetical protein